MRFIVDLYRYIIFGMLAVLLISVVYGGLKLAAADAIPPEMVALYAIAGLLSAIGIIILLGVTATVISIHDRHVELVEAIIDLRDAVAAKGDS